MTTNSENPHPTIANSTQVSLAQQAIDWFARLRSGQMSTQERQRFQAWLNASPAHQQAYQEVEAFWQHPGFHQALAELPLSESNISPFPHRGYRNQKRFAIVAMAACLVFSAILFQPSLSCLQADYCTATGETRNVQLADGSTVTLNSQTALNVNLQDDLRQVHLVQGEAYFEVQRNPNRPFVVEGHYSQTRVVGTRFSVRENDRTDTVTVVSGVVEVSRDQQQPAVLHANDQIAVDATNSSPIEQVSATATSAWMKGHLLVDNAPLSEVIAELSRYRRGSLIVKNARLKALKVSGRFDVKNTDKALEALEQTLPIHVYRLTPWLVVIA